MLQSITPRDYQTLKDTGFVPISLDGYNNDYRTVTFPGSTVVAEGIPFSVSTASGTNNLHLRSISWRDWKTNPGSWFVEYDEAPTPGDESKIILKVPVADYDAVYLLAATTDDKTMSSVMSLRIGAKRGKARTTYHDYRIDVPRLSQSPERNVQRFRPQILQVIQSEIGNLFLIRVPLRKAIAQDFKDQLMLDVEVTKELQLTVTRPDPNRFEYRPLGLPCGVHLFGMTFQCSAVQMEVVSAESGHIFNEPQIPTFDVILRKFYPERVPEKLTLDIEATDFDGQRLTLSRKVDLYPESVSHRERIEIPVTKRGHYRLVVSVRNGRTTVLTRDTTFALLPPNTRQHYEPLQFGVWDFSGKHGTCSDPDVVGPLYQKAGLRHGMFYFLPAARAKYGVERGYDLDCRPELDPTLSELKAYKRSSGVPKRWLVFSENWLSEPHSRRPLDMFVGCPPFRLNEEEMHRFNEYWEFALKACRLIRRKLPETEIWFGNCQPPFIEEFLRRGFPAHLFDAVGNDSACFTRLPEAQPPDYISNNSGMWLYRTMLDHYGYRDTGLQQVYEINMAGTNPGNLSEKDQACYNIRNMMHSIAWGGTLLRHGMLSDVGNTYYFTKWGAVGLCHAMPELNPKPSYLAMATLTLILDGATFERSVPTGSTCIYALEFSKKNGSKITCLWTLRGSRPVSFSTSGESVAVTDLMGNETTLTRARDIFRIELTETPIFVSSEQALAINELGLPEYEHRPAGRSFVISSLKTMDEWHVEEERSQELEVYNLLTPRRKGNFAYLEVEDFEGEEGVLSVKPTLPVAGLEWLPMYSVLHHRTSVKIPGRPTEIGLMVNGNGGWGRIIFELEDAAGQRWVSLGAEAEGAPARWQENVLGTEAWAQLKSSNTCDWNAEDVWGQSVINFDGWRYLSFPLPGNHPGERYHWPSGCLWRYSGDGIVHYPFRFTRLIITLPEKVLYVRQYEPVARQEIYLKDLTATYRPFQEVYPASAYS